MGHWTVCGVGVFLPQPTVHYRLCDVNATRPLKPPPNAFIPNITAAHIVNTRHGRAVNPVLPEIEYVRLAFMRT